MSQELTVSGSLAATKPTPATASSLVASMAPSSIRPNMSGSNYVHGTQVIGTSDETIALGDIATVGWVMFRNLDGTNYVTYGSDGSVYPIKTKASTFAGPFEWNGAAVHAKANTAACTIEYLILEA